MDYSNKMVQAIVHVIRRPHFKAGMEQIIWDFALVLPGMLWWHFRADNARVDVAPKVNVLPDPPHDFIITRKRSLAQLQRTFHSFKDPNDKVNMICIVGNRGTGKTELARQYGNFEFDTGRTRTVVHLSITSVTAFRESLMKAITEIDLKTTTGYHELRDYSKKLCQETIKGLVKTLQYLLENTPDWLLIIDDIIQRNITEIYKMLPRPGSKLWGTGRMIVTTRLSMARYSSDYVKIFHTEGLDVQEAEKLLYLTAGGSSGKKSDSRMKRIAYSLRKSPGDIVNVGFSMRKRKMLSEIVLMPHNSTCMNCSCCTCVDCDIFFCDYC